MNENEFDFDATVKEIQKIQAGNIEKVKALAQAGKGIDPGSVANIKIDTFIEMFLDKNAQAAYVLAMETRLRASLDEALAQVRQEQIVQGVNAAPQGLIVPR